MNLKAAIAEMYDEVQAGIDADALFVVKLQEEEREEYTIEERTKFLAKTIAAQRKFRAAQRSAKIKNEATRIKKEKGQTLIFEEMNNVKLNLIKFPDEEGEINYEVLNRRYPIVNMVDRVDIIELHSLVMKNFETSNCQKGMI
ncbi:hypothetical protein Tco_0221060 [Tanacetum coccineum]